MRGTGTTVAAIDFVAFRPLAVVLAAVGVACSNGGGTTGGSTVNGSSDAAQGGSGQDSASSSGPAGSGGASSSGSGTGASGRPDAGSVVEGGPGTGAPEAGQPDAVGRMTRFACPPGPFPVPVAGTPQTVCGDFAFKYDWNEGPTWITSEQAFFFSNFVRGATGPGDIIKFTPGGGCETWLADVGCNGLTAAYDGSLVGVCQTPRAVIAYDVTTKQPTTLARMYMGHLLDSPNDVAAHSNGSIYFSNPTYELGARSVGVGPGFFYIDPKGMLNLIVKDTSGQPNGVAISPDERRLYLEFDGAGVKTYDLDSNGVPSNGPKDFAGTTDGMSVDCAGNLYLSNGNVIAPDGTKIGTYAGATMAAFGGADGRTIIMVKGTSVSVSQINVPGPPH